MENQNTAIGLVVLVVILAIGALIITSIDTATRETEVKTVTAEAFTALNTNVTLTHAVTAFTSANRPAISVTNESMTPLDIPVALLYDTLTSIDEVWNITNLIGTGNYTTNLTGGTINLTAEGVTMGLNATSLNVTYVAAATALGATEYDVVETSGFIALLSTGITRYNNTALTATYTWTDPNATGSASNITLAGRSMFQNMTGLIPVLGVVFLAGIVIFFVIRGLGGSSGIGVGSGGPKGGNF